VAVLGSNGAGKTTLVRTLTGLLKPRFGKIFFQGESIEGMLPHQIIRKGIISVPEGGKLFGTMSVADNLLLGTYSLCAKDRKQKCQAQMERVFQTFPVLKARLTQKAETLSGGERQMLAVARSLMSLPRLIALDEPSLGLSPIIVKEMMQLLRNIRHEMGVSILLIEQNAKAALKIADHAYILERGEVVLSGTSAEIMEDPAMYSAYLGG
jgi:branched-chain amino acid transport system ATP-binding protein